MNKYVPQVWMVEPRPAAMVAGGPQDSQMGRLLGQAAGNHAIPAIGGDYPSHLPTDEELGVSEVNWKTHDGPNWMSLFDRRGVSGTAHLAAMIVDFQNRGIRLTPWCVPIGRNLSLEIEIASQVISLTNEMVFDVEVDTSPYFWKGSEADTHRYMTELRRRHPQARFVLQFDVRWPTRLNYYSWVPYMDLVVGMDYWTDFQRPMGEVLGRAWSLQQSLREQAGRPGLPFSFTYPSNSDEYPDWEVHESPIYLFRRGGMTPACVELVKAGGQILVPPTPPIGPVDPPVIEPPVVEPDWRTEVYNELVRQAVAHDELVRVVNDLQARQSQAGAILKG